MDNCCLDLFSICFNTSSDSLDAIILFWLKMFDENVSGKVYIAPLKPVSYEIIKQFRSDKFIWETSVPLSMSALESRLDNMNGGDALILVGAEGLAVCADNKPETMERHLIQESLAHNCAEQWDNFAKQIDRIFELANCKLSGLVVICDADKSCLNQVLAILEDSPNMSIMNAHGIATKESASINIEEVLKTEDKASPEKVLQFIRQNEDEIYDRLALTEAYANWLTGKQHFKEAAYVFRQIPGQYYEMIARINDLLSDKQEDSKLFWQYVIQPFENDDNLFNEAIFRASTYFNINKHYYSAYAFLSRAHIAHNISRSKEIIQLKMDILSDTTVATKALRKIKPYAREDDARQLSYERCKVLLEGIPILAAEKDGYYQWRDFLSCQESVAWDDALIHYLQKAITKYKTTNWEEYLSNSYMNNLHLEEGADDCSQCIILLRDTSFIERLPPKDRISSGDIMIGAKVKSILCGTTLERIWTQYYIARNDMWFSNDVQLSINSSLSLLEMINHTEDEHHELCKTLFLLSWANLQYRLGNCIESIACCISVLNMQTDATPLLEDAFNIIARYVGDKAEIGHLEDKVVFIEIFNSIEKYSKTVETINGLLKGDFQSQIQKLKSQIDGNNLHDAEWLIDFTNLVQILYKEGSIESKKEIAQYILRYQTELRKLVSLREDSAHQLLYSWEQMLLAAEPSIDNLYICISLLEDAIKKGDERRSSYHQDERAAISVSLNTIIREYLFVCGMLYQCVDITKDQKDQLKEKILQACSRCIPMSIIEQKEYKCENSSSTVEDVDAKRLNILKSQYYEMLNNKPVDSDTLAELAKEINALTRQLTLNHPQYKSLNKFNGTNWDELKNTILDKDVVYQYTFAKNVVISILCTNTKLDVRCTSLDPKYADPEEVLKAYGEMVDSNQALEKASEAVTELIATPLMEYVESNNVNRVFVIPEIQYSTFPMAASRLKGTILLEKVNEIINFIDYRAICRYVNSSMGTCAVFNRLYGKLSDPSISMINRWLKSKKSKAFIVEYCAEDSIEPISEYEEAKGKNTVAIYGHGVGGTFSGGMDGALKIDGTSHLIGLDSVLRDLNVENLIIISCLSGTTNEETPEISKGIWKSTFEQFSGNIIICKWSVPTQSTILLMDKVYDMLLRGSTTLGNALLLAQKELCNQNCTIDEWAGVEFWIN